MRKQATLFAFSGGCFAPVTAILAPPRTTEPSANGSFCSRRPLSLRVNYEAATTVWFCSPRPWTLSWILSPG
jgi:hypothetical protein